MEAACIEKAKENESRVRVMDLENDHKKVIKKVIISNFKLNIK